MADLVYRSVMSDIKQKILANQYPGMKLPDERSLSASYKVSRSSIKRALGVLAQQGIIFKKRGSGTFINPLYLKNRSLFRYEGSNLGVTDSFKFGDKKQSIKLMDYQVIPASKDLQQDLFLEDNDFVYKVKRLRLIDINLLLSKPVIFQLRSFQPFHQTLLRVRFLIIWKLPRESELQNPLCRLVLPHQRQMTSDCLN